MAFVKEFSRERDCIALHSGGGYAVAISQAMATAGWQGGQAVQWADSSVDEFLVTFSDGLYGGILLWGSNESSDQYTSMTGSQPLYGYGMLVVGVWLLCTRTFERYTYASRLAGPPYVENVYVAGEPLTFSLRGWPTREDEWALSLDPRAPNLNYFGNVVQPPTPDNDHYLMYQTSI
jgi:hypothetical protein